MNVGIIKLLDALKENTDELHPLRQEELADILECNYNFSMERKAVGRNINMLRELGYDIVSTRNGCYLANRSFSDAELRLLIDGVLSSTNIPTEESKDLINRIEKLSNKYFKANIKHIHAINDWSKTKNDQLFRNIELVDQAIEKNKQIAFDYNKYGEDHKLYKSSEHEVSPYQLILHNQRYYLMAYGEAYQHMRFLRVDHITGMRIIDKPAINIRRIPGYESGIDYKDLSGARPYMYSDKAERISFRAKTDVVDQIVDWFGNNVTIRQDRDNPGSVKCDLIASPMAMKYWLIQYAESVEVLSPKELRDQVIDVLRKANEKYGIV